jgi:aminocarboxymuconate-semialdehyde decarboxylase
VSEPTSPVVDVHNHVLTPPVEELIEQHYSREEIVAHEPYDLYAGAASQAHNRSLGPSLRPKMTDADQRVRDMDAMGVDIQVLATFVSQFYYWTDGDLGQRIARMQNEWLAELAARHPDRFAAVGTVPMQDSARAVAELEHVVDDLGFKGVQISSSVDGTDLDDPRFLPFWQKAEELGAVVLIHPNGWDTGRRLDDFYLINVIGNPLDSTVALTRLIFSGRLAQLPDLKLCVVHGGGYTPFYSARMDHAWEVRPECRANIDQPPSTYLKRVHFDTMVFSPEQLAHLVEFAGADHVVLGTDYPFDMGETDPVGLTGQLNLPADALAAIRGGNAARLFGIH